MSLVTQLAYLYLNYIACKRLGLFSFHSHKIVISIFFDMTPDVTDYP